MTTARQGEDAIRFLTREEPLIFKSKMTRDQFHGFVLNHPELKIECDRVGTITIHPPITFDSGYIEGEVFYFLKNWSKTNQLGMAFSPSTSFDMPDGAEFKADGAWISMEKINRSSPKERKRIAEIVPDFVIEVRSQTDRIGKLKKKIIDGWMADGVRLAWLIDPLREKAWVYRVDGSVQQVTAFNQLLS